MQLSELLAILHAQLSDGGDCTVLCTWEGQQIPLHIDNIYRSSDGSLMIDADHNYYRDAWLGGEEPLQ